MQNSVTKLLSWLKLPLFFEKQQQQQEQMCTHRLPKIQSIFAISDLISRWWNPLIDVNDLRTLLLLWVSIFLWLCLLFITFLPDRFNIHFLLKESPCPLSSDSRFHILTVLYYLSFNWLFFFILVFFLLLYTHSTVVFSFDYIISTKNGTGILTDVFFSLLSSFFFIIIIFVVFCFSSLFNFLIESILFVYDLCVRLLLLLLLFLVFCDCSSCCYLPSYTLFVHFDCVSR